MPPSETESALQVAASGGTTRLGALLAPMAVQYIVVPLAPAPDPFARDTTYVPSDLLAVLDGQLDLDSVTVNPGVRVYENAAYGPSRALLPAGTDLPSGGQGLTDRIVPGLGQAPAVLPDIEGYSDWSGPLDQPGQLFVSAAGDGWKLAGRRFRRALLARRSGGRTASPSSRPAPPRCASTPRSPAGWPSPVRCCCG